MVEAIPLGGGGRSGCSYRCPSYPRIGVLEASRRMFRWYSCTPMSDASPTTASRLEPAASCMSSWLIQVSRFFRKNASNAEYASPALCARRASDQSDLDDAKPW